VGGARALDVEGHLLCLRGRDGSEVRLTFPEDK
jgi:hypothetical protein